MTPRNLIKWTVLAALSIGYFLALSEQPPDPASFGNAVLELRRSLKTLDAVEECKCCPAVMK
jgi:hypothetical protein